jgi:hypothetical protein
MGCRVAWSGVVVAMAGFAMLLGACGGGGDDEPAFDGATIKSDDGVLTVQVPEGAAADGVEVTIERLSEEDLPSELQELDADAAVIVGYELGPDGAEFSEPVVLTFRVSPSDHELDLPDGAVPLGLLLTGDAGGELESIKSTEMSREDGDVVVRAEVAHFSSAIAVFSNNTALLLNPPQAELEVGEEVQAQVSMRDLSTGDDLEGVDFSELYSGDFIGLSEWEAVTPFVVVSFNNEAHSARISCTARTDGWVSDAYQVVVPPGKTTAEVLALAIIGGTNLFRQNTELAGIRLAGDGKCNAADDEETPEPTSTSASGSGSSSGASATPTSPTATVGPRSASNSGYDIRVSGSSGDTPVDENDCYGEDSPLDECPDAVDIVHMAWGMDGDQPDLLEVTVTFAGPFAGPDTTIMSVTVWGDDTNNFTVQAILENGEVSCRYPGQPDSPLPGESCGVNSSGQVEVALDVSGTAGGFRVSARSFQIGGDDRKEDKVYLVGIERP